MLESVCVALRDDLALAVVVAVGLAVTELVPVEVTDTRGLALALAEPEGLRDPAPVRLALVLPDGDCEGPPASAVVGETVAEWAADALDDALATDADGDGLAEAAVV